jgi:hypothetical protein
MMKKDSFVLLLSIGLVLSLLLGACTASTPEVTSAPPTPTTPPAQQQPSDTSEPAQTSLRHRDRLHGRSSRG